MKRVNQVISCCIAIAAVWNLFGNGISLTFAAEEPGEELVKKGGFEEFALGSNMVVATDGFFSYNTSLAEVSDDFVHSGSHSLKLQQNATDEEASINYRVSVKAGTKYKISAWVRYGTAINDKKGQFYIRATDVNNDFAWADRGVVYNLTGSDDFAKIEAVWTPTKDFEKARLQIGMGLKEGAVGYIDDFSCVEMIEVFDGNLIDNPGFEDNRQPNTLALADASSERTAEQAHKGDYSLKITQTKNYGAANYYPKDLKPGKTYYFCAWVRLNEAIKDTTAFYIRLFWGGDNDGQHFSPRISGQDGWVLMEAFSQIPADTTAASFRLNISAQPINNQPITFYIDDVMLKEMPDPPALQNAVWNQIGEVKGIPVCPTDAAVMLTFDDAVDAASVSAETVLLNGSPVDSSKISVTTDDAAPEQVAIQFSGLHFSTRYTLTLQEDSWKDALGRAVTFTPVNFKTCGRTAIGSQKLFINDTEVTDGQLRNGTVRAEVGGLKNMSGGSENVTAILALFRNGEMVGISSSTTVIPPETPNTAKIETELDVSMENDGTYLLKLFIWDDLKSGLSLSAEMVLQ